MKKLHELYKSPTPKKWRKLGDALLACAALVGGGGILAFDQLKEIYSSHELKLIIGTTLVIGIACLLYTSDAADD
jgi:hypothetical protein